MFLKKEKAKLKNPNKFIDVTEIDKYSPLNKTYLDFCNKITATLTSDEKKIILTFYKITSHPIDGNYICEDIDYIYTTWKNDLDNEYISGKLDYLIGSKKIREALLMCGQITYLKWLDKYVKYD